MRLLLDTHALVWWGEDSPKLTSRARNGIDAGDNEVVVSAVSAMEITTKFRLGKLPGAGPLATNFTSMMATAKFETLPISTEHAVLAGSLAIPHKDPFDRLLIAQAMLEDLVLVSNEAVFDGFGVSRLW
ncbi:MAG: type II toxin-antitoxin system VapC family toxin [Caulobacteraceae bacterium]